MSCPSRPAFPATFNGDGVVDGNDFLAWQEGFGTIYDGNDFLIWQENFDPGGGSGSVVPEPTSFTLLLLALVGTPLELGGASRSIHGKPVALLPSGGAVSWGVCTVRFCSTVTGAVGTAEEFVWPLLEDGHGLAAIDW